MAVGPTDRLPHTPCHKRTQHSSWSQRENRSWLVLAPAALDAYLPAYAIRPMASHGCSVPVCQRGALLHGCAECDWDICDSCAARPADGSAPATHADRVGVRARTSGQDRPTSGQGRSASGQELCGDHERSTSGQELSTSDQEMSTSGQARSTSGQGRPTSGQELSTSGQELSTSGQERSPIGERLLEEIALQGAPLKSGWAQCFDAHKALQKKVAEATQEPSSSGQDPSTSGQDPSTSGQDLSTSTSRVEEPTAASGARQQGSATVPCDGVLLGLAGGNRWSQGPGVNMQLWPK